MNNNPISLALSVESIIVASGASRNAVVEARKPGDVFSVHTIRVSELAGCNREGRRQKQEQKSPLVKYLPQKISLV